MEQKIYDLLYCCYSNSLCNTFVGVDYQLFTTAVKSLIPFEDRIGCEFDLNRYKLEIQTLKYYVNGSDSCLKYYYNELRPSTNYDENMMSKLLPIIVANTEWETLIEQSLKCSVFYTYNKKNIFDTIIAGSLINEYLNDKSMDISYLNQVTRDSIINFSIKDFFENNYDMSVKSNFIINFEKERIMLLMKENIFDDEYINKSVIGKLILSNDNDKVNIKEDNEIYINNFATYLFKLRKGIIDPDKLKTNINKVAPLNDYIKSTNFKHPLLGNCSVVSTKEDSTILRTKIGYLKVKK